MKKYEINRMAVLVDLMAECIGCDYQQILRDIESSCIGGEESSEIGAIVEDFNE